MSLLDVPKPSGVVLEFLRVRPRDRARVSGRTFGLVDAAVPLELRADLEDRPGEAESLLITTARSKFPPNASSRSWVARFTSEPFSPFSQISTVRLAGFGIFGFAG